MALLESGQLLSDSHLLVVFCEGGKGDAGSVYMTPGERES